MLREGELRELLAAVDLEYLLDREGMDRAVNWHDSLSLGAAHRSKLRPVSASMHLPATAQGRALQHSFIRTAAAAAFYHVSMQTIA